MKKQNLCNIIMLILVLFSLTFVSARSVNYKQSDTPNLVTWQEWTIEHTTDLDNYTIEFSNKYSPTSEIWLVSKDKIKIESLNSISETYTTIKDTSNKPMKDTEKNVYKDKNNKTKEKILTMSSKIDYEWNKETQKVEKKTKYGFKYQGNGESSIKIGDFSTIVAYVNQSGGLGLKGWNVYNSLIVFQNNGIPVPTLTQQVGDYPVAYNSTELNTVSTDNGGTVFGIGSGLGGADCTVTGYSISGPDCGYYTTAGGQSACLTNAYWTPSGAISCDWINNACIRSRPCADYDMHQLTFNVTRSGITNITLISKTTSGSGGNPSENIGYGYYLFNYSSTKTGKDRYIGVGTAICVKTSNSCNFTYSITDPKKINDFVSASGLVTMLVQTGNVNTMNMKYAQLSVNYVDITLNYRSTYGNSLNKNYRSVIANTLFKNWRKF